MTQFLTSRSRVQTLQRCPRARYWLDEWNGTGLSPVRVAVPLATGSSVHKGLAALLEGVDVERSVEIGLEEFTDQCKDRGLDLQELESQSYVYNEQLALVEALIRLVGMRVLPRLLEEYEVLEVERMDTRILDQYPSPLEDVPEIGWEILWRSIPDALLRDRVNGDLFVLSWKTLGQYDQQRDQDARTDAQGLSEPWALEQRLGRWHSRLTTAGWESVQPIAEIPQWFVDHYRNMGASEIRGVQMVYLVKGSRRKDDSDHTYKSQSILLRGYKKDPSPGLTTPEFCTDLFYTCSEPHPFRYAKGGICPGNANHKRTDFERFQTWDTQGGVKAWIALLAGGGAQGQQGIDALDAQWIMTVPHFRPGYMTERWERQTRAIEARTARSLIRIRECESALAKGDVWDSYQQALDEEFPQTTERCGDWFGRKCPCWDLCHGSEHVARDPLGSGLYQVKVPYEPVAIGGSE